MENELTLRKKNYFKEILSFYFRPDWQSALTIFYLLFFLYFAVFYIGNVKLALQFIYYTVINSGYLLGLSYLSWGVVFLITLITPFSISLYSMTLLYEVWEKEWTRDQKILGTVMLIVLVPAIIIFMDLIIRLAASQSVLQQFVEAHNLNLSGK